jgi:ribonuclease T2
MTKSFRTKSFQTKSFRIWPLRTLTLGAVALILGATSGAAVAQQRGDPGQFDYYVLSLSWSPSFCATPSGARRGPECGARPLSFVVHGLWPQFERGFPESCQVPPPRLDRRIVSGMLDLMPAPRLVYHEWDTHGTCSGLDQHDYFDLIRKARAAVKIPAAYDNPQQPLNLSPDEIVDAFVQSNAGLAPDDIVIACNRSRLSEVRICLTRELAFRSCGASQRRACRSDNLILPPVRGRS